MPFFSSQWRDVDRGTFKPSTPFLLLLGFLQPLCQLLLCYCSINQENHLCLNRSDGLQVFLLEDPVKEVWKTRALSPCHTRVFPGLFRAHLGQRGTLGSISHVLLPMGERQNQHNERSYRRQEWGQGHREGSEWEIYNLLLSPLSSWNGFLCPCHFPLREWGTGQAKGSLLKLPLKPGVCW